MGFDLPGGDCSGRMCGYSAFDGELGCDSGSGTCWVAYMCEAEMSRFHDETLQKANRAIKEILEGIPADPAGRKLSFVHTEHGTMLAWVRHGVSIPDGRVTFDSGPEKVRRALGIRDADPKRGA